MHKLAWILVLLAVVNGEKQPREKRNYAAAATNQRRQVYGPPPAGSVSAGASFGSGSFAQRPSFGGTSSSSAFASAGGGSNGGLSTQCRSQETSPGKFKFVCDGIRQDLITLKSEHILWLTSDGSGPKVIDIEVPNYKIEELIKAGYKTAPGGDTQINVLLRKPEQAAQAEVDVPNSVDGGTVVNLQYEPAQGERVHFPNDRQYSPLSGPIQPPFNPRSGGGRFQRHSRYRPS